MAAAKTMTPPTRERSTAEKVVLFRACFSGLEHVYGTYDPGTGSSWQVKAEVTDHVIVRHLQGRQPFGVYLLTGGRTRALAVDFDDQDLNPPMEFLAACLNYGLAAYLERSKSKGYHVWLFFDGAGADASKARMIVHHILAEVDCTGVEVFPKQDRLRTGATYGNFINAPLFGRLVPEGRTVFLDPHQPAGPIPNQWDLLAGVERIAEARLDDLIEINDIEPVTPIDRPDRQTETAASAWRSFGLPPCGQRMLAHGVTHFQRVSCFHLAVQLRKAGIPQDMTVAALHAWSRKNHPTNGKRIITPPEIENQVASAYARPYHGCGCEHDAVRPYCHPDCPLRKAVPRAASSDGPADRQNEKGRKAS